MSRHRSSSKKAPPEIGLHMECVEEELEPSQVAFYSKCEKEYNEIQSKLDNYVKKMKAEVVEKGENCLVLQLNVKPPSPAIPPPAQVSTPSAVGVTTRQSVQTPQNYQPMVGKSIITRSGTSAAANTYLVMNPNIGFVVSPVQSSKVSAEPPPTPTSTKVVSAGRGRQTAAATTQATTAASVMVTTRAKSNLKKQAAAAAAVAEPQTPPATRTRDKTKVQAQKTSTPQSAQHQVYSVQASSTSPGTYRVKANAKQMPPPTKPTENNALGGLSAGSKTPWKPSSGEESSSTKTGTADSKEMTFNKVTGKTFPSLVVVARPHLKVKYIRQSNIAQERSALDAKVKGVLMYTPTKFTEWLIQQGLIRSEQICQIHVNNDLTPVKLKFGMYSDVSKFPYSGGYVWISDCCPSQFVSVFSGSIFEGAPHPPTTILKLIYHWACQTNVQNVVQWVKVDNLYVKNFYTNMRAVCTQAVHEKCKKMGGLRMKIEVGVISLGTTSQDGNRRQVKVEVLGVVDQESKQIRLRAVEPLSEEKSFKKRFIKILEPLEDWVHKDSAILTDFTVDKAALNSLGFHNVFQSTCTDPPPKYSNQNVMEYLRRIVPRMFQNTLSLLSRQIIQQFLDELVWREMWGPIASQAFDNIIAHMAEQTKLDVQENFLVRLNKVASNPFKKWDYSVWKPMASNSVSNTKTQQVSTTSQDSKSAEKAEPSAGKLETPPSGHVIRTRKRAAEQPPPVEVSPKRAAKTPVKEKIKKEVEKQKTMEKVTKKEKETGDKMTEEMIKFIAEEKQIPLNSYYYGSKDGHDQYNHEFKGNFNVKCSVCNKRFNENIILMKHMILHCQTEPALEIDLKKVIQCEYCFLGFNNTDGLKTHLEEVHFILNGKLNTDLICHICEKKFQNRNELVFHMHRMHVELELPYECGVCHFRTSIYKTFVDHFTQFHKDEEHVFCPYCLKVVTVWYKGAVITHNVLFYMSHLEKHQRSSLTKDCNRCQLTFIHKGILDQHLEADHGTWKNENGVQSISDLADCVLMPAPGGAIKPAFGLKVSKSPKTKNLFTFNKFKGLTVYGLEEDMACVECEGSLTKYEHFTGSFNCLKCRYATCCERAMIQHSAVFHETANLQFTMGKPIVLPKEMYCVCEYSSSSGNRMAKHIALCEKKSAYSSRESATAAFQSPPTKTKISEVVKQGDGQNVLNMLGLVRKSPEHSTPAGSEATKTEVEKQDISMEMEVKQEKEEIEADSQEQEEDQGNISELLEKSTISLEEKEEERERNYFEGSSEDVKEALPVEEEPQSLESVRESGTTLETSMEIDEEEISEDSKPSRISEESERKEDKNDSRKGCDKVEESKEVKEKEMDCETDKNRYNQGDEKGERKTVAKDEKSEGVDCAGDNKWEDINKEAKEDENKSKETEKIKKDESTSKESEETKTDNVNKPEKMDTYEENNDAVGSKPEKRDANQKSNSEILVDVTPDTKDIDGDEKEKEVEGVKKVENESEAC